MTSTQLSEIKVYLETRLAELESYDFDISEQACADANEYASVVADAHIKTAMHARTSASIKEIRAALKKISYNDYGYCEDCGGEIGLARLKARPAAVLCVDCQSALERAV